MFTRGAKRNREFILGEEESIEISDDLGNFTSAKLAKLN